jgi:hypothetical protein
MCGKRRKVHSIIEFVKTSLSAVKRRYVIIRRYRHRRADVVAPKRQRCVRKRFQFSMIANV